MKLSSTTANYEVEIKNAIDFNGAERTIYVADNPNSTGDFASETPPRRIAGFRATA